MVKEIVFNLKNLLDVMMVLLLDTPVSIIGTLWRVVIMMHFFNFTASTSAWIVMSLFLGLIAGLPAWGRLGDRYKNPSWIVILGATVSMLSCFAMYPLQDSQTPLIIAGLFFLLGFFSSCQSIGFTWLTSSMKPELIGRNSAYNSMIFMGANGEFKQLGAFLLSTPVMFIGHSSASNLLFVLPVSMFLAAMYAVMRNKIFKNRE